MLRIKDPDDDNTPVVAPAQHAPMVAAFPVTRGAARRAAEPRQQIEIRVPPLRPPQAERDI